MDSITHLALGAVIGEAMYGKVIGKRALLLGALAQFTPDCDVVASLWLSPSESVLAHRGFTHSFLFVVLTSILFAFLADRWHKRKSVKLLSWVLFFSLQMMVHILLDSLNAYGVGWFEPFSNMRISFNTLFVADPLFSIWVIIGGVLLIFLKQVNGLRVRLVLFTLIMSSCYLIYCVFNKLYINGDVKRILAEQNISYQRYFTTPTPLNSWLWYVVAESDSGYFIGYRSVFDNKPSMPLSYFSKQDSLLERVNDQDALRRLRRFSKEFYTIESKNGKLVFNDLRFGQSAGWHNPKAPFVFYYYLDHPEENTMAIQRGRIAGWNKETIQSFVERIKGN